MGLEKNYEWDQNTLLAEAFAQDTISIAQVDLHTGMAKVIRSLSDKEMIGKEIPWAALAHRYADRRAFKEDQSLVRNLTLDALNAYWETENGCLPLELRCVSESDGYDWVQVAAYKTTKNGKQLLIVTRNVEKERMLRKTVKLFVYNNFDYVILINAKQNTHIMYSGASGVPLPPVHGDDYTTEVALFNSRYVAPEDEKWVTAHMQLPFVVEKLETQERYEFTNGMINDQGEYRRVRVQFLYYDRQAGLILLTRTDVTRIYEEELLKNKQLAKAIRDAQHDLMTGLYNKSATEDLISRSLENQYRYWAAFLFVDVDNFKMVNDTLGHQKGDDLLRYLADTMKQMAGKDGIAGRVGGDEFLLFLPVVSEISFVENYADKICSALDAWPDLHQNKLPVSCSVGISVYPQDSTDYQVLIRKADQALYTSKRYGKNRYSFYSEATEPAISTEG